MLIDRVVLGMLGASLLLCACGSAPQRRVHEETYAPPDIAIAPRSEVHTGGQRRPPTSAERDAIEELFRIAERVRELRFAHPVPVEVQDRAAITEHLLAEVEEEDLDEALVVYAALGLLPSDMNLRDLLVRVLGEQVVGYYDPPSGKLVVRDDVMRALRSRHSTRNVNMDEARIVLVHEMVHALQDQHLGLREVSEIERDSDPDNAFRSVVEGDATLAMMGYMLGNAGATLDSITRAPGLLRGLAGQAAALPGAELEAAPAILRVTLVAPYVQGMIFSAELHGRGGWEAVNEAHRDPPPSTEQVLHPSKYLRGERPDTVEIPRIAALETAGLTSFSEDTLGELEMQVYLGQAGSTGVNEAGAAGWNGDRLRTYRNTSGEASIVWFTSWDNAAEATEAAEAARVIAEAAPTERASTHLVERVGRAVLIVRWLPSELHSAVRRAFGRFARGLSKVPQTAEREI